MIKINQALTAFLIMTILVLTLFTSCEKEEFPKEEEIVQTGSNEITSLDEEVIQFPNSINNYVDSEYPQLQITSVEQEDNEEYEVELSDGTTLIFDMDGSFLRVGEEDKEEEDDEDDDEEEVSLTFNQLPTAIQNYLNTHYPNNEIEEAELENGNIFEIELDNGTELYFDNAGNLLYIETEGDYEGDDDNDAISLTDLPTTITEYISINYPTQLIVQADFLQEEGVYKVRLQGDLELYFDTAGNLVGIETEFRLTLTNLEFPDTVQLGTTVELRGELINQNIKSFQGDLNINYGIEDEPIASPSSTTVDGEQSRTAVNIAPGESIPITIPIVIDNDNFNKASFDIVIVWPEVTTANAVNPFIPGNEHQVLQTYVQP